MREILFKAKRIDNSEWVEGYYFRKYDLLDNEEHFIFHTDSYRVWEYAKINPETLCQFTGICDANGKRVFENDIVKAYNTYVIVEYGCYQSDFASEKTKHIGFYVEWPEDNYFRKDLGYWIGKGYTVIGNIFDNPELLQEGVSE